MFQFTIFPIDSISILMISLCTLLSRFNKLIMDHLDANLIVYFVCQDATKGDIKSITINYRAVGSDFYGRGLG